MRLGTRGANGATSLRPLRARSSDDSFLRFASGVTFVILFPAMYRAESLGRSARASTAAIWLSDSSTNCSALMLASGVMSAILFFDRSSDCRFFRSFSWSTFSISFPARLINARFGHFSSPDKSLIPLFRPSRMKTFFRSSSVRSSGLSRFSKTCCRTAASSALSAIGPAAETSATTPPKQTANTANRRPADRWNRCIVTLLQLRSEVAIPACPTTHVGHAGIDVDRFPKSIGG